MGAAVMEVAAVMEGAAETLVEAAERATAEEAAEMVAGKEATVREAITEFSRVPSPPV